MNRRNFHRIRLIRFPLMLLIVAGCGELKVNLAHTIESDSETGAKNQTDHQTDSVDTNSTTQSDSDHQTDSDSTVVAATCNALMEQPIEQLTPSSCAGPSEYDCNQSINQEIVPRVISCESLPTTSFCDITSDGCRQSGCIDQFTIRYDFATDVAITELRFLSDWHSKRPNQYQVWVGQTIDETPQNGAVLAFSGTGQHEPWACITGEACSDEVPDACCPNGRDQPQDTVNVGDMYAKWDISRAGPLLVGTHWYFVVVDTRFAPMLILKEVQMRGRTCP